MRINCCHHAYLTVTVQVSDTLLPYSSVAVTVITVEPPLRAVTLPLSSTVATFGFEDVYVSV